MRDTRPLLPSASAADAAAADRKYQKHLPAPKQKGTEGRTGHRIAPKKCLT